jgi:spermidine/putrescine-binding protein
MNLKKVVSLGTLIATIFLTGCGASKPSNQVLNIYNVGDYIDESLVKKFEEETGIEVVYETYDTNESMYQKIKGGSSKYDLIFPSDYMIEKMIDEDMLLEIDFENIPNYKYIGEEFKNAPYDKEDKYSVPYLWGTLGILYNTKIVKEKVDSFDILWDEKYKGEIQMLDSVRDSFGISLKRLGYSMNSTNINEINEAKEELAKQKQIVQAYVNDEGKDRLLSEEASIGVVYSGDALTLIENNPNLAYVIPKEGTNRWVDAMCIPNTAENKKEAEMFINFMLDPENAKINVDYIGYPTPNTGALELLDSKIKNNPVAYPSSQMLQNCESFANLSKEVLRIYDDAWIEVKSR